MSLAGGNVGAGTGAGAGKVAIHEITITKKLDVASPKLSQACAQGKHYSKATITLRKAGKAYLTYVLTNVLISSYQVSGAAGGGSVPLDRVTLNFSSIKIQYSQQKA